MGRLRCPCAAAAMRHGAATHMPRPAHHLLAPCLAPSSYVCSAANGMPQKLYNWNTLNTRVFKRLGFQVPRADVEAITSAQPGDTRRRGGGGNAARPLLTAPETDAAILLQLACMTAQVAVYVIALCGTGVHEQAPHVRAHEPPPALALIRLQAAWSVCSSWSSSRSPTSRASPLSPGQRAIERRAGGRGCVHQGQAVAATRPHKATCRQLA